MLKSEGILAALAAAVVLGGCVQTTTVTGGVNPDADQGDAADLNYELGARYYRNGNFQLARDRLMHSIKLNPRNPTAHYTLALTYEKLGNLRLATDSYEDAIRIAPRDFNVQNVYAVFLCSQEDYEGAAKYFDRAAKVVENDNAEITLTNAGLCMLQKPDRAQAEQYFRAALDRKPSYGEALLQLCLLKFAQEDYLAARAFLQRYLSGNASSAGVLYLGVRIEQALGDVRARTDYENRLIREFPESEEARRVLQPG